MNKIQTQQSINDLAVIHDEQMAKLDDNLHKKEEELIQKNNQIKQLTMEAESANIYLMGTHSQNKYSRMCPMPGCNGQGNIKTELSTHYT